MSHSGSSWREAEFGVTREGQAASVFTLKNRDGLTAQITNYGGTVTSLRVPDRDGRLDNIVLGFETLADYESGKAFFGALIGRYGNRIAGGRFELDGVEYLLATNHQSNHLHGGERGFDKVVWDARIEETATGPSVLLSYLSEDGEEGYPGNLKTCVRYTLSPDNRLIIEYQASSDHATPVNLTHHGYFNLSGNPGLDVLGHEMEINADHYTPVNPELIPTGEIAPVEGTPFDFRSPRLIGSRIEEEHEQLLIGGGYDHNYVLIKTGQGTADFAARVHEPASCRVMEVYTSEPGMQFFSGNALQNHVPRAGFCLETQHFPDSPNQPHFPSTTLRPGETFQSRTVYSFSVW
jgi:aldose 1-epimerase